MVSTRADFNIPSRVTKYKGSKAAIISVYSCTSTGAISYLMLLRRSCSDLGSRPRPDRPREAGPPACPSPSPPPAPAAPAAPSPCCPTRRLAAAQTTTFLVETTGLNAGNATKGGRNRRGRGGEGSYSLLLALSFDHGPRIPFETRGGVWGARVGLGRSHARIIPGILTF